MPAHSPLAALCAFALVLGALYVLDAIDLDLRLHGRRALLVRSGQLAGLAATLGAAIVLLRS